MGSPAPRQTASCRASRSSAEGNTSTPAAPSPAATRASSTTRSAEPGGASEEAAGPSGRAVLNVTVTLPVRASSEAPPTPTSTGTPRETARSITADRTGGGRKGPRPVWASTASPSAPSASRPRK